MSKRHVPGAGPGRAIAVAACPGACVQARTETAKNTANKKGRGKSCIRRRIGARRAVARTLVCGRSPLRHPRSARARSKLFVAVPRSKAQLGRLLSAGDGGVMRSEAIDLRLREAVEDVRRSAAADDGGVGL